jgi:hypothetical protein
MQAKHVIGETTRNETRAHQDIRRHARGKSFRGTMHRVSRSSFRVRGHLGGWEGMLGRPHAPRYFGAIATTRQGCDGDDSHNNCDILHPR